MIKVIFRKRYLFMLLSEFAANEEVKSELSELMKKDTLPHAMIIEGAKGTGKKTLAEIIARFCVCSSDNNRPCGMCGDCIKAEKNIHPDIFIADGNNSGELNIEAIRNIRSDAYIKPNEAAKKVYILLNCEKMLMPAQNAFLKILEEPPENVIFILTAVSAASLLQTVRSRSRILSLYPPTVGDAAEFLRKRFPDKDITEIQNAAKNSIGNIGNAIEFLEGGSEESRLIAEEILKAIPLSTEYSLLIATNKLSQNRALAVSSLDILCELISECVKASAGIENTSALAKDIALKLTKKRLFRLQEKIVKARDILNTNVNLNFYGTWLCAELRNN